MVLLFWVLFWALFFYFSELETFMPTPLLHPYLNPIPTPTYQNWRLPSFLLFPHICSINSAVNRAGVLCLLELQACWWPGIRVGRNHPCYVAGCMVLLVDFPNLGLRPNMGGGGALPPSNIISWLVHPSTSDKGEYFIPKKNMLEMVRDIVRPKGLFEHMLSFGHSCFVLSGAELL